MRLLLALIFSMFCLSANAEKWSFKETDVTLAECKMAMLKGQEFTHRKSKGYQYNLFIFNEEFYLINFDSGKFECSKVKAE